MGSILIARKVPNVGGDTLFADMEAAYEFLDDATQSEIKGMKAIHQFAPMRRYLIESGADAERLARSIWITRQCCTRWYAHIQ